MATRQHRETHNVEQTKKMIPFVAWKSSFGLNVCEWVFLVSTYLICILGSRLILSNNQSSVGSWHVSHRWTSSFDNHFDHGFVVLNDVQLRPHFDKNVCWWVRDPLHSIDQPFAFFCHVGSWLWNKASHELPRCHNGWVGHCCWMNVVPHYVPKTKSR